MTIPRFTSSDRASTECTSRLMMCSAASAWPRSHVLAAGAVCEARARESGLSRSETSASFRSTSNRQTESCGASTACSRTARRVAAFLTVSIVDGDSNVEVLVLLRVPTKPGPLSRSLRLILLPAMSKSECVRSIAGSARKTAQCTSAAASSSPFLPPSYSKQLELSSSEGHHRSLAPVPLLKPI